MLNFGTKKTFKVSKLEGPFTVFAFVSELTEFVLQLDEEVEGMQAAVLHLDLQLKESKNSAGVSSPVNSAPSSSSAKSGKDRTKGTTANGPVETASVNSTNSSLKT